MQYADQKPAVVLASALRHRACVSIGRPALGWLVFSALFGCAGDRAVSGTHPQQNAVPRLHAAPLERAAATQPLPSSEAATDASPAPSSCTSTAEPSRAVPLAFARLYEKPVSSFAAGKPPRAAVLAAGSAELFDGKQWIPIRPDFASDQRARLEIFFGRDNLPRVLGFVSRGDARLQPLYRRVVNGQWREARDELGPLAAPSGALYGVLGHADPEVVCRPQQRCIVKRTSGWATAPAHVEPVRILLSGGSAWALSDDRIERLERDRWVELEPRRTWRRPRALFSDGAGALYVIEENEQHYWRLTGAKWVRESSPVRGPRDIWGRSPSDLWIAGEGGAAHFDGAGFACAGGVLGPLSDISFDDENLWLAGESGVWRSQHPEAYRISR